MAKSPDKIEEFRRRIDALDEALLRLLNDRMLLVEEVGAAKRAAGRSATDPARERDVLRRLRKSNPGPLSPGSLEAVWREIFSAAKSLEEATVIAYLGPEATFSHLAAQKHFGRSQALAPMKSIREVFLAVEKGECAQGVVPVENSTEGSVTSTLDMLIDSPLSVVDEILIEVHHHLLSREEDLSGVAVVYSHPQALAQCQEWLQEKLPGVRAVEVPSTAEAARQALQTGGTAAIASELAASLYGLRILARRIEDRFDNRTRFIVVGPGEAPPTGRDKTSLAFSIRDEVGALHRILAPLARAGTNLTRIESRPSRQRAWDYVFFVDLEGHKDDPKVAAVLDILRGECPFFKILGSYPNRKQ